MSAAVVTGAGRGIGRAIAVALAQRGFDLALSWLTDKDAMSDTAAKCEGFGVKVRELQTDVRIEAAADQLADVAVGELGGLDIWVNNAGVSVYAPIIETTAEQMSHMSEVNLLGTFYGLKAAAKRMLADGTKGRIINIASDLGLLAATGLGGYSATKFAVVGLTQAAALELGPDGISVNAICPGTVETDMVKAEEMAEASLRGCSIEEVRERLVRAIPAGRLCTVEDVGTTVAWMADGAPSYLTGQSICVNGGSVLR